MLQSCFDPSAIGSQDKAKAKGKPGKVMISGFFVRAMVLVIVMFLFEQIVAQGIPEPGLVVYGQVLNEADNQLFFSGVLTWRFRPTDGTAPVTLTTFLEISITNSRLYSMPPAKAGLKRNQKYQLMS